MANINADEDESFLKIKHKVEVSQHQLTKCTPQEFQDWWFAKVVFPPVAVRVVDVHMQWLVGTVQQMHWTRQLLWQ